MRTKRGIAAAFSSIDFDEDEDEIVSIGADDDETEPSSNIASPKKKIKSSEPKH